MKYEEARAAFTKMLQEGREGPYYSLEEVEAHIQEMFRPENLIYNYRRRAWGLQLPKKLHRAHDAHRGIYIHPLTREAD